MRLAGAAAVAALLGTGLPASALPSPPVVEMRGTITLSGSTGYVRELVLRKPFTMTPAHRTVQSGGGRYAGFVLRKHGGGVLTTPTIASINPGYCPTRGCVAPSWAPKATMDLFTGYAIPPGTPPQSAPLPPGRYRLALVADGKPVTVTLRFPGSGRTTITNGTRTATRIASPQPAQFGPATPAANTGQLYAAGVTHRTAAEEIFYFLNSWKLMYGPPRSVNQQGVCLFDGPPIAGPTGAYQYPCAGSEILNFTPYGQQATGRKTGPAGTVDEYAATTLSFGVNEVSDELSIGGFINGASPATAGYMNVLFVDL